MTRDSPPTRLEPDAIAESRRNRVDNWNRLPTAIHGYRLMSGYPPVHVRRGCQRGASASALGRRKTLARTEHSSSPRRRRNPELPRTIAGGAAIFFGLRINTKAYLSDLNTSLIDTYLQVREGPDDVWRFLRSYHNNESAYYAARRARPRLPASRAARFIFLNHASFNGIYRVNLGGQYNVPYGYRNSYNPPLFDDLKDASGRLQSATLSGGDFATALDNVGPADLVFLDPPYTVAHNDNGFVKYNDKLFLFSDQRSLSSMIDTIRERRAYYILTNAAHQSIAELFEKGDRRLETSRKNAVGGRAAIRGRATEYLFTNLPEA
jgi:DNA adenine methylase